MAGRYIEIRDGVRRTWRVERLWELSAELPVESVPIADLSVLDEVTWFDPEHRPTGREVVRHCRRINEADLSFPILLSEDGKVFDGVHRIARCLLEGRDRIDAKRFPENPEPDEIQGEDDAGLETIRRLEWELNAEQHAAITELRNACFPDYAVPRSWFKQRPQLRYLIGRGRELVAHMGVEHRMISIAGEPVQIFGVVDLCVAEDHRGQGHAGRLLEALEAHARECGIDALVLMADDPRLYRRHGYSLRPGPATWLRIDEHKSYGVAEESLQDLMIKPLKGELPEGPVDVLGHLF